MKRTLQQLIWALTAISIASQSLAPAMAGVDLSMRCTGQPLRSAACLDLVVPATAVASGMKMSAAMPCCPHMGSMSTSISTPVISAVRCRTSVRYAMTAPAMPMIGQGRRILQACPALAPPILDAASALVVSSAGVRIVDAGSVHHLTVFMPSRGPRAPPVA